MLVLFLAGCESSAGYDTARLSSSEAEAGITVRLPKSAPPIRQHFRRASRNSGPSDETVPDHRGIDIVADQGTPVIAAAPGEIITSFYEPLYGNHVVIAHGRDETGRRVKTWYKHLDARLVKKGDHVARGQQIGTLGKTGILATGILHLHFEVHREVEPNYLDEVNPHLFWVGGVGKVTCFRKNKWVPSKPFRIIYPVVCKGAAWK